MKDEIITIKTARLLKEKGFDIAGVNVYTEYHKTHKSDNPSFAMKKGEIEFDSSFYFINNHHGCDYSNKNYTMYSAPTQSLVQRWIREKHNLIILVGFYDTDDENNYFYSLIGHPRELQEDEYYKTYEEAMEIGLYRVLSEIK